MGPMYIETPYNTGFLLSCSRISTTVKLDYLDFNEMLKEKKLDGNYKLILETARYTVAVVRQLTSHLENYKKKRREKTARHDR